jgi:hypothetical protein
MRWRLGTGFAIRGQSLADFLNHDRSAKSNMYSSIVLLLDRSTFPERALLLATHSRGGLRRMVLGSVAERVVRQAMAPVLAYRPGKNS